MSFLFLNAAKHIVQAASRMALSIACIAILISILAQSGIAAIITLQSGVGGQSSEIIQEAMLVQGAANNNYGGRTDAEVGVLGAGEVRTTVMRFDVLDPSLGLYVSGVPQFSSINSITLTLTTTATTAYTVAISDNMDLRFSAAVESQGDWVEGTANSTVQSGSVSYSERKEGLATGWSPDTNYTRNTGDGVLATQTAFPGYSTAFTVNFTAPGINGINTLADLVNRWATGNNEGILINDVNRSGNVRWFLNSSENATTSVRPLLTIDYTPIPEPSSFAMLLFGSVMLWLMGRKRSV